VHLTARSDKSVAYVTNNKRLYSMLCVVEATYWQTRSIAWPLCDSRAICYMNVLEYWHVWFDCQRNDPVCTAKWQSSSANCCKVVNFQWYHICMAQAFVYIYTIYVIWNLETTCTQLKLDTAKCTSHAYTLCQTKNAALNIVWHIIIFIQDTVKLG